jgi:hypothetical protein
MYMYTHIYICIYMYIYVYICMYTGDEEERLVPTRIGAHHMGGCRVTTVAAASGHSLACTEDGCVYSWGKGANLLYWYKSTCFTGAKVPVSVSVYSWGKGANLLYWYNIEP